MQQVYGNRRLMEEYNENRRQVKTIQKTKKKEWMNVELENMELLRKQYNYGKL
jgi:hypothetical protein